MHVDYKRLFDKYITEIESRWSLKRKVSLSDIRLSSLIGSYNEGRTWGAYWDGNVLVLDESLDNSILELIVAREAFNIHTPSCIQHLGESLDLGWAFALTVTKDHKILSKWIQKWNELVGYYKVGGVNYWPSRHFYLAMKITRGKFLDLFLEYLLRFDRNKVLLSKTQFVLLFRELFESLRYPFDVTDIKIIQSLQENPNKSILEVAKEINLTYQAVHKKINKLMNHGAIYYYWAVDYQKIGFTLIRAEVTFSYDDPEVFEILTKNKFLYSLIEFVGEQSKYSIQLLVPLYEQNYPIINLLVRQLKARGHTIEVHTGPFKTKYSWNFQLYDPVSHQWIFKPISWFLSLESLSKYLEIVTDDTPLFSYGPSDFKTLDIDVTDVKIIAFIERNMSVKVRQMRKALKMNTNELIRRVKRLKSHGIIKKVLALRFTGLTESIFLTVKFNEEHQRLMKIIISNLPYTNMMFKREGSDILSYIIMLLPPGSIVQMLKFIPVVLSKFAKSYSINIGGVPFGGSFVLKESWWDQEKNRWKRYDELD
ncbi:MAG: winged helix-turn-helix transcriptional regulator [Candidatus Asgardarchaeia archaeon]